MAYPAPCLAAATYALPLARAAVHCDWLVDEERIELAQELTDATCVDHCAEILNRWEIGFDGTVLIDLTGEIAHG
jgi:hypothetical protein